MLISVVLQEEVELGVVQVDFYIILAEEGETLKSWYTKSFGQPLSE